MNLGLERGEGFTATERALSEFSDRSFLRLWSYPNTFNDRTKSTKGVGQELADLLVVFGSNVIIFSDKNIAWQSGKPTDLAWSRWYRGAVESSVKQLVGAERWIDQHPDRIFLDNRCEQKFPIPLPSREAQRRHLVAVANGANNTSKEYFNHPRGTFIIAPTVKGKHHMDRERPGFQPFVLGDVNPDGTFVHVFDQVGLQLVMRELDTVVDFVNYLGARARLLRSGRLSVAAGEDDLIATYMMNAFVDGKAAFVPQKLRKRARRSNILVPEGQYETYTSSYAFSESSLRKEASRFWDQVIEAFTEDVIAGTSVEILGQPPSTKLSERGLRIMASENRSNRIQLAEMLYSALERTVDEGMSRLIRRAMIKRSHRARKIGYIFLGFPYDPNIGTMAEYRRNRAEMLNTYCLTFLQEQPKLETVVGIAFDIYREEGGLRSRSEDLIAMDSPEWTFELKENLASNQEIFGIKSPKDLEVTIERERKGKSPFRIKRPARP
ncbi:hypothetical protein CLG85_016080 [Yangia mangrovi]|uniref:Uncharacterized protein n=1 Tax=Alloyangia mangrovi TaxID=1779329 RepID=A0ABT2KNU7_9RHOB|nr:hypothetical protein [Alloyangia mangrovi]MCT4371753.1 hypothetical protein [Alloyangia mangrovi]